MKKTQGRVSQKKVRSTSKKSSNLKKLANGKTPNKIKAKTRSLLGTAKKKLNALKKKSAKSLKNTKKNVHTTEKEIMKYVKENPIKSYSAMALSALIAGYIAYRNTKSD